MKLVKERWPNKLGWNVIDPDHCGTGEEIEVAEIMDFSENMAVHVKSHRTEKFFSFPRTLNLLGTEVALDPLSGSLESLLDITDAHGEDLY